MGYVIVSIVEGGPVHAYGTEGDPGGEPFATRSRASTVLKKMDEQDERTRDPEDKRVMTMRICKVIGGYTT